MKRALAEDSCVAYPVGSRVCLILARTGTGTVDGHPIDGYTNVRWDDPIGDSVTRVRNDQLRPLAEPTLGLDGAGA